MSYSLNFVAPNADAARLILDEKLTEVIERQPIHARDREAAVKAVKALVAVVNVPEGKVLKVSVSGSCGWDGTVPADGDTSNVTVNGVGLNISVSLTEATEEKA